MKPGFVQVSAELAQAARAVGADPYPLPLQREVAHRVKMKYAAKLKFLADESFDEGSHIDSLLRSPKVSQDLEAGESSED